MLHLTAISNALTDSIRGEYHLPVNKKCNGVTIGFIHFTEQLYGPNTCIPHREKQSALKSFCLVGKGPIPLQKRLYTSYMILRKVSQAALIITLNARTVLHYMPFNADRKSL